MAAEIVNPAKGTLFKHGTPYSSPVYTTVAQIVSLDGPEREVGTRETTIITSTVKTYAPTIPDNGEVTGKLLYDPKGTTHAVLETLIATPSLEKWEFLLPDTTGTTLAFDGILTKFAPTGLEVEANLEADFTVKVSGPVVLTDAPWAGHPASPL